VEAALTQSLQQVAPEAIQNALDKIWESYETTNTTRASLFNLIFYTKKGARAAYVEKLASRVVEKFPSRILLITMDDNATDDFLKAEVAIFSSKQGEYDVACDYIHFEAGGAARERLFYVLLPHILPDLPIYCAWSTDPNQDDPLLLQLDPLVSRLIFDSEATEDLPRFAANLLEHCTHTDVADLNWARIEDWRALLSMVFQAPEHLQEIAKTKTLALAYNAQESQFFCRTRIQAIYLQAWIASALKWEYKETKENDLFTYQTASGPVEVALTAVQNSKLPPGLILDVTIESRTGRTYEFKRDLEEIHRIFLTAHDEKQCELPAQYIFPKAESGHSLVKEITHRGTSKHFFGVLKLLQSMKLSCLN
jgi:glucose-6-phosphate dehydrogenase assembly protein OpcA